MNEDATVEQLSQQLEQLVKPLSNPLRIRILLLLKDGPISYSELLGHLQIESGSFYWHLKKMQQLVKQTGDKQYYLSELGETAIQLLQPEEKISEPEQQKYFSRVLHLADKLHKLPNWIVAQQLILLIVLATVLFYQQSLLQFGTIVEYKSSVSFGDALLSIILSLLAIGITQLLAIKIYDVLFLRETSIPITQLFTFFFEDLLFLGNLLLLGFVSAFILWIDPTSTIVTNSYFIVIGSAVNIILTIILSTGLLIENLGIDDRDALIIQLIVFYPVLISIQFLI